MKSFYDWLDVSLFLEGHHYLRRTGPSIERELNRLALRCGATSGTPDFRYWDSKLKDLIRKVEKMRPLRRSEYIDLYGYNSWLKYVADHGLPESHKWADADRSQDQNPIGEGLDASDLGRSAETIQGWKDMPRDQKQLIHYHRLSEKYGSELGRCKALLEDLLAELGGSFACRGVAERYRKRLEQMTASFNARQVPGIYD